MAFSLFSGFKTKTRSTPVPSLLKSAFFMVLGSVLAWVSLACGFLFILADFSTWAGRPAVRWAYDFEPINSFAIHGGLVLFLTVVLSVALCVPALVTLYFCVKRLERLYYAHFRMPRFQVIFLRWAPVGILVASHFVYLCSCLVMEPRFYGSGAVRSKTISKWSAKSRSIFGFYNPKNRINHNRMLQSNKDKSLNSLVVFYPLSLSSALQKHFQNQPGIFPYNSQIYLPYWSTAAQILRTLNPETEVLRSEWQDVGFSLQDEPPKRLSDELKKRARSIALILGARENLIQAKINLQAKAYQKFRNEIRDTILTRRIWSAQLHLLPFSELLANTQDRAFSYPHNSDKHQIKRAIGLLEGEKNVPEILVVQLDEFEWLQEGIRHPLDGLRWQARVLEKAQSEISTLFIKQLDDFFAHVLALYPATEISLLPYKDDHPTFALSTSGPGFMTAGAHAKYQEFSNICHLVPSPTFSRANELKGQHAHFFWERYAGVSGDTDPEAKSLAAPLVHNLPEAVLCGSELYRDMAHSSHFLDTTLR